MASSSSSRPLGNVMSEETDSLPHCQSEQLPVGGWDVFLSHSGQQKPFVRGLDKLLSPPYNVFFDIKRPSLPLGEPFPARIIDAARTCRLAVVVLSNSFFCSKWPMVELSEFVDAGVQILPLFYELSPGDLKNKKKLEEWHKNWEELASKNNRIKVSKWDSACQTLCLIDGLVFNKSEGELAYLEEIVTVIYQMTPPLIKNWTLYCPAESAMASSSSSRPLGNLMSKETDHSQPHRQSEQLHVGGWDVFLSYAGDGKGIAKGLYKLLSSVYNVFLDVYSCPRGEPSPTRIKDAAETCRLAVVILSNTFFRSKWPMLELTHFLDASVQILPLFYELSPGDLKNKKKIQEWHKDWKELASKDSRIKVSKWDKARQGLGSINGFVFKKSDGEQTYLEEVVTIIYGIIPPLCRSSHVRVQGRDRLCKVFIDKFEELEERLPNSSTNLSRVYLLGVYGLPGSGKSTLCVCLHDHFSSSFAGRSLYLILPTNPTHKELLSFAKQLFELTNFGRNEEMIVSKMVDEVEDFLQIYGILRASNLRSSRVFLVIDSISSQESIELVEAILQLGLGAGSRVLLVAHTLEILSPLLNFQKLPSHFQYVCDSMTAPSINETEAVCWLMQSLGSCGLTSNVGQENQEEYNPISHRGLLAKVARTCAFRSHAHGDLLYLPLALKTIGQELIRFSTVDLDKQPSQLEAIVKHSKEVAVSMIVEESYMRLPEKQKLLFLDVALFVVPCCLFSKEEYELAVELLGFMHECKAVTIKRELNDLMRLCFLESGGHLAVHDLFLEFAKSVPDAPMFYCRRDMAGLQGMLGLSLEVLRVVMLEVDEKCVRLDFPVGLSSVKVVVVRQFKSLEVLGVVGLTSLVSLHFEDCPRLRHVQLDPSHAHSLKIVRQVKWVACEATSERPQQGSVRWSHTMGYEDILEQMNEPFGEGSNPSLDMSVAVEAASGASLQ